jgi:hypothetical protein
MDEVHGYIAYAIPTAFAVMALWSLIGFIRNKAPGDRFWTLLAGIQVVLGIQVLIGGILYLTGARPATPGPEWRHYTYGGLFPLFVLIMAHRYARKTEGISWMVFGGAAVVIFGLTFMALRTGTGAS